MKPDYGREPLHPTPPRAGYGPPAIPQTPGPNASGPQQGSVMMVYGLDPEKINADKLFNIFCLYGNVLRVSIAILDSLAVECSTL
jgi:heterogeneous nuclear ribonucleoprotein L